MHQIVLDTETTGLRVEEGHRVIEIAAVVLKNRYPTDKQFHTYVNPGQSIDEEALRIHGINDEFLANKPKFADIAEDLWQFVRESELIIHNAEFDISFLDNEFKLAKFDVPPLNEACNVIDTLELARELRPGRRNSLDALAMEYGIDLSERSKHGALIDARILARVYRAMTGGQGLLKFGEGEGVVTLDQDGVPEETEYIQIDVPIIKATEEELSEHESWLEYLDEQSGGNTIFRQT